MKWLDERFSSRFIFISLAVVLLAIWGLYCYQLSPDFSKSPAGDERKTVFISYFEPLVEENNTDILEQRRKVLSRQQQAKNDDLSWWQLWRLKSLAEDYGFDDFDVSSNQQWSELLARVDIIPPSMAIAQAAKESAWGTSRFAKQGNNFFGQWCYEKGCGLVPTKREADKTHEVETFGSPKDSVREYMHNLNTNKAYRALREIRMQLRRAKEPLLGVRLIQGLVSYSERGVSYVTELDQMIRFNHLQELDTPGNVEVKP